MRRAVVRRSCVAGVAALSLTLLSACSDAGGSEGDSGSKAPTLSAADLEKAVLKDGDVKGHKPTVTVDRKDVEPGSDECAPVAYAMVGSVVDEPSATVQRETAREADPAEAAKSGDVEDALNSGLDVTRVLLRLSAYDSAAARTVMKSLDASAATGRDFEFPTEVVEAQVKKLA
ncbi:hypothetical protein PV726_12410 [Streptomyces europaeiscabiei]|uniref:hypothetical protein n=1 Tax=Streptomyces europaeiscabiei TaxID=146819 RepID=UPI0029A6850E|nr:hypothetical protein [Streptomyces europaeiscabiei]MDX3691121.1 hypothetical protein [Streptomyces europaeiscabiei]